MLFHKTSTKNTLFAVNKAIESIDNGIRFMIGFLTPIVVEFSLVSAMIWFYFGPVYLGNVGVMLFLYTYFTRQYSKT